MDTVRADHLSTWGYKRNTMPNVEKLCKSSFVFKQAISPSAWTIPTHSSLFTGLFPSEHGAFTSEEIFPNHCPTLPGVLSKHGYKTIAFTNNIFVSTDFNFHRGFDEFVEIFRKRERINKSFFGNQIRRLKALFLLIDSGARWTNEEVSKWLSKHDKSVPFFMFINYMEAHHPLTPPRPFNNNFDSGLRTNINALKYRNLQENEKFSRLLKGEFQLTSDDIEKLNTLYDMELSYLDYRIGELLGFMAKNGYLDNTIIILTADHGDNLGEHNLLSHQFCLYDTLVHVPLIIKLPDCSGRRIITKPIQLTDIFPTILEMVEIEYDYIKILNSESVFSNNTRKYAYAEYKPNPSQLEGLKNSCLGLNIESLDKPLTMIRSTEYKLITSNNDADDELYDLQNDPGERRNIIKSEKEVYKRLKQSLDKWQTGLNKIQTVTKKKVLNRDIRKHLEDLGYL